MVKGISLLNYSSSQYITSQGMDGTHCEPQKNDPCQSKCVIVGMGEDLDHFLMKSTECST